MATAGDLDLGWCDPRCFIFASTLMNENVIEDIINYKMKVDNNTNKIIVKQNLTRALIHPFLYREGLEEQNL